VAQLGVATLDKGVAIACEPRLDLSHSGSTGCINTYGLASKLDYTSIEDALRAVGKKNNHFPEA
jgi:hypothetical protein